MKSISLYFCLLYAAVTQSYEINKEGVEGGQIWFLCPHKLASSSEKYFCKHPCDKEEDVLAKVLPGRSTAKGKLSLSDFGNGVFNVTFHQLQLSDTHLYYCAVERLGFNTYTSVDIRVQKAVTTLAAHVSSTLPSQPVTSSAPLLTDSTMQLTGSSTATSSPENEKKVKWGAVLYATAVTFAALTLLILAAVKCKDVSKPQLNICPTNRDPGKQEIQSKKDCEKNEMRVKTVSQSKRQTSRTQELPVYENLQNLGATAGFRLANYQKNHKGTSEIYINVLP